MSKGSRVIPIAEGQYEAGVQEITDATAPAQDAEASWLAGEWEDPAPLRRSYSWLLPLVTIAGWTGFYVWAGLPDMLEPASPELWIQRITDWSLPVLLVCTAWLVAMRSSRRETSRFADAARSLREEAVALENRLTSVNAELSIAREFITSQSRDLESLGRMAAERLSKNAEELRSLIHANGEQINAIGTVSTTALDNMEQLRGHLPVIASSAKDVTNNIANAGRSAHAQLQELIRGFGRLNEFGLASEQQVQSLRDTIDKALAAYTAQSEEMGEISAARFSELSRASEEFRARLDSHEIDALAAIRTRANALAEELEQARIKHEQHEADCIANLHRRLDDVAEQASAVIENTRTGLKALDIEIAQRRANHEQDTAAIAAHSADIVTRLGELSPQLAAIGDHGDAVKQNLVSAIALLNRTLSESRETLVGTDAQVTELTEASVRLLELIQASIQHSRNDLSSAISGSDKVLSELESRVHKLRASVEASRLEGAALAEHVIAAGEGMERFRTRTEESHTAFESHEIEMSAALSGLEQRLESIADESRRLAGTAREELHDAVTKLADSARDAFSAIENLSDEAIAGLAARLGDASRDTIGKAIQARMAEAVEGLEQAAVHASGAGREAAIQLRDQLAKVNELAANLERRVAHARTRAEEQVDHDFARRVALITESLNSNAIDIAKVLSSDVSDTAWSAYLKGDRGIFTRRAVSLLDATEVKAIAQLYEFNRDFSEHVSRYIHDFEAMLRQLLSTRDGHALGVTLLSSDMGKLYVALAQAIERLRT